VPLKLSRRVARVNKRIVNPIQRQYAWLLPPWALIVHRGRRTGRIHRTPVNAYRRGSTLAAVILYGEDSDWVQNVLAGGGHVVRGGRTYELLEAQVLSPEQAAAISPVARVAGRLSGKLLVGRLGDPRPGFGRGPR